MLININRQPKKYLVPIKNTALKDSVFYGKLLIKSYPNLPEVEAITNAPKVTKFPTVK